MRKEEETRDHAEEEDDGGGEGGGGGKEEEEKAHVAGSDTGRCQYKTVRAFTHVRARTATFRLAWG